MSEYAKVKSGSLRLKGMKKKKKKKKRSHEEGNSASVPLRHGLWAPINTLEDLTGVVLMESDNTGYIAAVDNGTLSLGPPWAALEGGPTAEMMVTVVKVSESRVAFKTAFGRYVSVDPMSGDITAKVEAMGTNELWQPIYREEAKGYVFRGVHKKYLKTRGSGMVVTADVDDVKEATIFQILTSQDQTKKKKKKGDYEIEGGSLGGMETSFAKKFQSYRDGKVRVSEEDRRNLKSAMKTGRLHEQLLDRREKLKADRYCK